MKKILLTITCLLFVFCISGCSKTVNLSDFATIEFSGIDGSGKAVLNFDYEEYEKTILGEDINIDNLSDIGDLMILESSVDYEIEKAENLSNGDTITVTFKASQKVSEKYNVKFSGLTKEYTVSGLKEKIELNAFDEKYFNISDGEGVYLDFKGIAPNATLEIRNTISSSNPLSKIKYIAEKATGIKKDEEITITAQLPYDLVEEGYVLKSDETKVKSNNVNYYATDISQIDEESLNLIKQQCDDLKISNIDTGKFSMHSGGGSGEFKWSTQIENFKYGDMKLLSLKEDMEPNIWDGFYNKLIIEFSIDVNDANNQFTGWENEQFTDIAGFFEIEDIVINKDGKAEIKLDDIKIGTSYKTYNDYTISEINENMDDCVVSKKELNW